MPAMTEETWRMLGPEMQRRILNQLVLPVIDTTATERATLPPCAPSVARPVLEPATPPRPAAPPAPTRP